MISDIVFAINFVSFMIRLFVLKKTCYFGILVRKKIGEELEEFFSLFLYITIFFVMSFESCHII